MTAVAREPDPSFEALLDFLKRSRGIDFTGYKRASLERRFRRRLDVVGCRSFGDYLDFLEANAHEFDALFDTLLINVTEFFRDPESWACLRDEVLPELIDRKPADESIRVWSAGCASGPEAYTIAICLAEVLGLEDYRTRVKIYGTDIDDAALDQARAGVYSARELESVPVALRERYFEDSGQGHAFRKDLRRTVIFGRNNLVQDAPISRLDLLVCRNTLMYLTAETQARILRHYHFALTDGGVLMLGKSEMMLSHRDLFAAVDLKRRIFAKQPARPSLQARLTRVGQAGDAETGPTDDGRLSRDAALELGPQPQLIVSRTGVMTFANLPARALFGLGPDDIGRPFQDLEVSYRLIELRRPVEASLRERRRIIVGDVAYHPDAGDERVLSISVAPLLGDGGEALAVGVIFEDVSGLSRLQLELDGNRHELEQAYEELQSTIDELETTNEELQSANEELQTTNEELQSTNEELETMNEELQSTNEELETINDELRDRTTEVNRVNDFLEAILSGLGLAVAVIDREQRVQIWNHRAEDLWGVRQDEAIEHPLLALDFGLPTERLVAPLRAVIGGSSSGERVIVEAVNRRGRAIVCVATIRPLVRSRDGDGDGSAFGAIVLMEDTLDGDGDGDGDGFADGHAAAEDVAGEG
jgi:two-component system CheB/CheR fusion protein